MPSARDHHGDGSPMGVALVFVWHADGMPDDDCSAVSSLLHLPGISEGEGLREGLVERGSLGQG
jgi:hypothetical protein